MLIRKCVRCKSTNIDMIDEEVLRTKKTVQEIRTILVKYWRCKLCGFEDIINEIWINNKLYLLYFFYFKKYTKVALVSVFLLLKAFLYLISNFSSGLVLKNIKVPIVSFFLNTKILSKDMLRKWEAILAFPHKVFSL